jgi:hypothetical protein
MGPLIYSTSQFNINLTYEEKHKDRVGVLKFTCCGSESNTVILLCMGDSQRLMALKQGTCFTYV